MTHLTLFFSTYICIRTQKKECKCIYPELVFLPLLTALGAHPRVGGVLVDVAVVVDVGVVLGQTGRVHDAPADPALHQGGDLLPLPLLLHQLVVMADVTHGRAWQQRLRRKEGRKCFI